MAAIGGGLARVRRFFGVRFFQWQGEGRRCSRMLPCVKWCPLKCIMRGRAGAAARPAPQSKTRRERAPARAGARAGTPAADADAAHLATAAERALQMLMKLQGAKRGRGCEYVVIR